jgi:hypothetical protein
LKPLARIVSRIALLAMAAALLIGLTGIFAQSIPPPRVDQRRMRPRRRPTGPQLSRVPGFLGQIALFSMITLAGRKVLGLRLSD